MIADDIRKLAVHHDYRSVLSSVLCLVSGVLDFEQTVQNAALG